ncbi:MAG: lipopolysaccharide heptosyltransferase II [Phycisphaerales bacterium]|nr:lipopolysaccharide heptosyltransferase II [Phycisphaerales bacterium]NNM27747.1 lipopolysaccharide heptosyltransferase II [Phycisphaerales bacterium]
MSPPPLPPDLASLLVIAPNWVGDVVMATPVLRALREHRPAARIVSAVRPGIGPLLRGAGWADELIDLDPRGALGPLRAARRIRQTGARAVLLLPNSFRSGLTARLARCPVRVGYDRDGRGRLLTHACPVPAATEPTPTVDYYAHLGAFALGLADIPKIPALFVTGEEADAAAAALDGLDDPIALLTPGASKPAKRWPPERFAAVADTLSEDGFACVVSGSPGEASVTGAVVAAARTPITDLTGALDLGVLKAVVRRARVLITNDTGPRHLAAALGTPAVTLFGPTDHRWTTLPEASERCLLAEPFLPAEAVADRNPRLCAITRIPVRDVVDAARRLHAEKGSPR